MFNNKVKVNFIITQPQFYWFP